MRKPFNPEFLPVNFDDKMIVRLYKKAIISRNKITEFSTMLERGLISDNLLKILSLNESVHSTKIEGTQATLEEVMESEITNNKNNDVAEVMNYLEALNIGQELLKSLPISTRLILKLHEIVLKDSRGKNKAPGQFRKIQNWIGSSRNIEEASYIPPSPDKIDEYISNLEQYMNNDDDLEPLIKIAIIHAQFETIHPFLDGNGRVGRILITLYLLEKGIIKKPSFFVSEELEKNRYKYYSTLNNLRNDNPKWEEWITFFLESTAKQAEKGIEKLKKIEELYQKIELLCTANGIKLEYARIIFKTPIFSLKMIEDLTEKSYTSVKNNIGKLEKLGVLFSNDRRRNKIFYFIDLLDILRG